MNTEFFENVLLALFATFSVEADPDLIRGYTFGLSDLSEEELKAAVARAIRECEKLPRPAELRKLAGVDADSESRAIAAWNDVLSAIVKEGRYRHVDFEDRVINASIRNLGGWSDFIDRVNSEEKWARLDFLKAYQAFFRTGVNGEICKPLAGLSTGEVRNGQVVAPVVRRIGCEPSRARIPHQPQSAFQQFKIAVKGVEANANQ